MTEYTEFQPKVIFLLSGKRKSGKDYFADLLKSELGDKNCCIVRLSGPLKEMYAKIHNLNYEELLKASKYKELHRENMIKWGEEKRKNDPSYFCQAATCTAKKHAWIISDARRKSDIEYFKSKYKNSAVLIRIDCGIEIRRLRGFCFTLGIDDAPSECDLDNGVKWDFIVNNSGGGNNENLINIISSLNILFKQNL